MTPQQKDNQLTIGQRIDVFEVKETSYPSKYMPSGSHRAGTDYRGYGADIMGDNGVDPLYHSYNPDFGGVLCRKVGTLVVTKLKGEDGV